MKKGRKKMTQKIMTEREQERRGSVKKVEQKNGVNVNTEGKETCFCVIH